MQAHAVDTMMYTDSLLVAPPTQIAQMYARPQRDWHPCRPGGSSERSGEAMDKGDLRPTGKKQLDG